MASKTLFEAWKEGNGHEGTPPASTNHSPSATPKAVAAPLPLPPPSYLVSSL